jgi:hypothetical protein
LAEAGENNEQLKEDLTSLESVLIDSLSGDHSIDFATLKDVPTLPRFNAQGLDKEEPPPSLKLPRELGLLQSLWPPADRARRDRSANRTSR